MPNRINVAMTSEYSDKFGDAPDMVVVDIQGLSVEEFGAIRNESRDKELGLMVVKNSLARNVLRPQLAENGLDQVLQGPTALLYGAEMPDLARFAHDQAKKTGKFAVRGGVFEKAVVDVAAIEQFRSIPDRPTLLSQVLATIIAPMTGSLGAIQTLLASPAALADALAKKKEEAGE